jgi:hypothetical protein
MTREGIKADALSVLHEPTPETEVKQRQGPRKHAGDCPKFGACPQPHMMLDYVDARYVMDKLDHLGPENWQDRYVDRDGGSVRCGIGLLIDAEWVWKWDVGTVSDIEPEKGSYSEAFKRAAVKWGIGRDLYGHKAGSSAPAGQERLQAAPAAQEGLQAAVSRAVRSTAPMPDDEPPFPGFEVPHGGWSEGEVHADGHKPLRARANGSLYCPTKVGDAWCTWAHQ